MSRAGLPLVTLVILDGWGIAPAGPGNAVSLADTPTFDELWAAAANRRMANVMRPYVEAVA